MDAKMTPMLRQYLEIKKQHSREILFFRLGDFYEMFFEDAHVASKALDIALTARQNDVPMCGIPFHAAENYIARLIKAGHRVAICEQTESTPSSGTIVKREVVRIITPGTITESNLLAGDDNNFLVSVILDEKEIGLSFIDISTGDFFLSVIPQKLDIFRSEIARFTPREAIFKSTLSPNITDEYHSSLKNSGVPVYELNDWFYDEAYLTDLINTTFRLSGLKGLELTSKIEIQTAGSILQYLNDTQKKSLEHLKFPKKLISRDYMVLDEATINNLELVTNQHDQGKNRTLFSVLNYTKTAMGKRLLERNILQPLLDQSAIDKRLDLVEYLTEYSELRTALQSSLAQVLDLERLTARFAIGRFFPRDFIALADSLVASKTIKSNLLDQPEKLMAELGSSLPDLTPLATRIKVTITDDPALTPEQGRIIREGFNSELDHLYELKKDARSWIINYQEEEKNRLGSSSLKIKYNRVVGYYIEISKGQLDKVPADYLRKQTLVNAERFTTEKLQKFESDIASSSEKIIELESSLIADLALKIQHDRQQLQILGSILAEIDFYSSLSQSAIENRFTRPAFNPQGALYIKDGRHPVVERYYTKEIFIPNDIKLDQQENLVMLLTGPNMSGKSTFIRMSAILQLMAQLGSFVPASEANLAIVDRIFTRIGASDNISRGESTFLVEMNETAIILNNATDRSLIIMDEVGRGTSTYDGLSIAWAIVEYISRYIKAKTLFATHYHELTELGGKQGIVNYNVMVREGISGIEFMHKVVPGAADKSYGIHVASLAGIPREIINRAQKILMKLEKGDKRGDSEKNIQQAKEEEQLEIFNASNHLVLQVIKNIDTDNLTPLEALNEINKLKKLIT